MTDGPVLVAGASGFVGRRLVAAPRGGRPRGPGDDPAPGHGTPGPANRCDGDVHDPDDAGRGAARAAPRRTTSCTPWTRPTSRGSTPRRPAPSARPPADAGVEQIIYLGGLGSDVDELSAHLRSRREVEGLLGPGGVPVTVLRAGIVVGHGGHLLGDDPPARRAPAGHGHAALGRHPYPADRGRRRGPLPRRGARPPGRGRPGVRGRRARGARATSTCSAGSPRSRAVRCSIVPVPLLTPGLSSRWLALVTDVDTQAGRSLVDSMTNEVIVARRLHPARRAVRADGATTTLCKAPSPSRACGPAGRLTAAGGSAAARSATQLPMPITHVVPVAHRETAAVVRRRRRVVAGVSRRRSRPARRLALDPAGVEGVLRRDADRRR